MKPPKPVRSMYIFIIGVNQVCLHYLDSKLMGHTTANDLLKNVIDVINNLDVGNHI